MERRCSILGPTQIRMSPSVLPYTKIKLIGYPRHRLFFVCHRCWTFSIPLTPIARYLDYSQHARNACPFNRDSQGVAERTRKVDARLPGKGNSNSHGARPVHLIISMMKWSWTSRFSVQDSLPCRAQSSRQTSGLFPVRVLRVQTCKSRPESDHLGHGLSVNRGAMAGHAKRSSLEHRLFGSWFVSAGVPRS